MLAILDVVVKLGIRIAAGARDIIPKKKKKFEIETETETEIILYYPLRLTSPSGLILDR